MTNQAILEKAISKAIDGGWAGTEHATAEGWVNVLKEQGIFTNEMWNVIIFNHDFAKALWGEALYEERTDVDEHNNEFNYPVFEWQDHLQRMVIAEDPVAYLGKNI